MGVLPEKIEKWILPIFLIVFEIIMLILYFALVEYDSLGTPAPVNTSAIKFHGGDPLAQVEKVYPLFQDVHVMIFIGFGFLMTFLRRYGYSSVSFNFLVAAFAIQWATIIRGLFSLVGVENCCKIKIGLETMVNADFVAAAVLITMGALLGRVSHFQLIIIAMFEIICYAANEAINNEVFAANDVGGSMIIHTFGAYFGLAASTVLFHKKARDHTRNSSVYHADLFSMIGTVFLWLFWPSFNAVLAEPGDARYRTLINTYYSMTGSVISSFLLSILFSDKKKLDMVHVQNATLAGGVAVGAVANMMLQPWGAMFIGFSGGIISVVGFRFLSPLMEKIFILDTCGVHNLHGMPGVFSGLVSIITAAVATKANYGQTLDGFNGDRSSGVQAGFQMATLVSTLVIAIVGGLLTGLIARFLPVLQSTSPDELYDDEPYWELADDADNYLPITAGEAAENDVIVKTQGKDNIVLQYSGTSAQPPKPE